MQQPPNSESIAVVTRSLELCAEASGDITPRVYEHFFSLSDAGTQLMAHSDQHMRGRMLEQVFELLMSDEGYDSGGYLEWELNNHMVAYKATATMYGAFFEAITKTVREGLGTQWTGRETIAWANRIDRVMEQVNSR